MKWKGHPNGQKGHPPRRVSIGEWKELFNGEKGCSLGRGFVRSERNFLVGRRVSPRRGRNFPTWRRGTTQEGALSRTKGNS
jgi:hypothetical protein